MFLKFTVRHFESVRRPSSKTCNKILNTSGCAFSISSNRITEYGFLRTASVNCPPSSYPTYPGGDQINLATACFSIYSDISIRIIELRSLKRYSASDFASSVFPTHVGHAKRNDPIGLFGSCNHALLRLTAFDTTETASSCHITRLFNHASRLVSFSISFWINFSAGIPVRFATTLAIS